MANDAALQMAMLTSGMYGPNPYSQFPGRVPQPGYVGTPTDAQGRPIQPPPGMTLNSTPAAAAPPSAPAPQTYGLQPSALGAPSALNPSGNEAFGMANWGGMMSPQARQQWANQSFMNPANPAAANPPQPSAAAATGPPGPPPSSLNDALALLANPGHVTTPGATVPETTPVGNQVPSVMSQFLANQGNRSTSGAGNYSNAGFFNTLNALQKGVGGGA